jgi:hypothetical protein
MVISLSQTESTTEHFLEKKSVYIYIMGRDRAVATAVRYGLDGPGIESRSGRDNLHPSTPSLGST